MALNSLATNNETDSFLEKFVHLSPDLASRTIPIKREQKREKLRGNWSILRNTKTPFLLAGHGILSKKSRQQTTKTRPHFKDFSHATRGKKSAIGTYQCGLEGMWRKGSGPGTYLRVSATRGPVQKARSHSMKKRYDKQTRKITGEKKEEMLNGNNTHVNTLRSTHFLSCK